MNRRFDDGIVSCAFQLDMKDDEFNERLDRRFEKIDAQFFEIRQLIVQEGQRTRNHFDAVSKRLEDRIKLGFEGYTALRGDVSELKEGQQRLEAGHGQLDIRLLALESRVISVERVQKVVLTEVRGLATKVDRLSPRRRPSRRR